MGIQKEHRMLFDCSFNVGQVKDLNIQDLNPTLEDVFKNNSSYGRIKVVIQAQNEKSIDIKGILAPVNVAQDVIGTLIKTRFNRGLTTITIVVGDILDQKVYTYNLYQNYNIM